MALLHSSVLGSTISCVMESQTSPGPLSLKAYERAKLTKVGKALRGSPLRLQPLKVLDHHDKRAVVSGEDPRYHSHRHPAVWCDQWLIVIILSAPSWFTRNVDDVLESPPPLRQSIRIHQEFRKSCVYSPTFLTVSYSQRGHFPQCNPVVDVEKSGGNV
jgi:hypothetical protein